MTPGEIEALVLLMRQGERVCVPQSSPSERAELMMVQAAADATSPRVQLEARRIRERSRSDEDAAFLIMALTQSLPSRLEKSSAGCWDVYQGAEVTLREGGNCTAKTILGLSLARALGLRATIGWCNGRPGDAWDHVAPMYHCAGEYKWGETLVQRARLGEHPYAAKARVEAER